MSPSNKHTTKSLGLSLLITIFAFYNVNTPYTSILFVSVASFISIYLISRITAKAYQKFLTHTDYN